MLPPEIRAELRAIDFAISAVRAGQPPSRRELAQRHKKGEHYIAVDWYADFVKRWRRGRERRVNELLAQKKAVKRAWYETGALP